VLSAIAASTLFASMALVARLVSATIPGQQVALVRFATGALVIAIAHSLGQEFGRMLEHNLAIDRQGGLP
jgi:hypothetical protein